MFLTKLKVAAAMTLALAVASIPTAWWAFAQAPAEAPARMSQADSSRKPPSVQRPLGKWEREAGPYHLTLRIENDRLFGTLTSKELSASLEADYSVTRDYVLYGVITGLEVAGHNGTFEHFSAGGFASMRGFEFRGAGRESGGEAGPSAQLLGYKRSDLSKTTDQPFSIRFRLDDESLTLKGLKFMGGEGGKFAGVIQGRYRKASAGHPEQVTKPEDPPDEATVLRALHWHGTTVSELQIVRELVVDRLDPVRFYPQVGPAQLRHRHWKCTVYFRDAAGHSRVEVVYVDKDHLEATADP